MKARILVVDDSSSDRLIIKSMLKDFDVLVAKNGVEAIDLIKEHHDIDLVILDLNMPIMNGFEVLDIIGSSFKQRNMRVIILTNYDEIENEIKGLKSGAVDYIRKPINIESLKARIDIHVELLNIQKYIEQKYSEQSFTFDTIFYEAPIGIAISFNLERMPDNLNEFLRINPMFEQITGYSKEELAMLGWATITHPEDLEEDLEYFHKLKNNELDEYAMDKRFVKPDGTIVWVHMVVARLKPLRENHFNHICLIQDISKRKDAEAKLQESERSKSVLLSHLPGLAYRCNFDRDWTMKYVSDGCLQLTGYSSDAFIDNKELAFNDIITAEYQEVLFDKWMRVVSNDEVFDYEYQIITANNERKWVLEIGQGIKDKEGKVEALEGLILDITERKDMENNLRYNSEHDLLTGLYNLNYLVKLLKKDNDSKEKRALIGINLRDFHFITTNYGFQYTIDVKRKLGDALFKLCNDNCIICNTYENQFVVYYKKYNNLDEIMSYCDLIIEVLNKELSEERIGGGIGIVEINGNKEISDDQILRNLLIASERAIDVYDRDFGVKVFDELMQKQIHHEEHIKNELHRISIGDNQEHLILHYQPIVDVKTNLVIGFEALSRIKSDDIGLIPPNEFIPIAEKTKLIIPLGELIINHAFQFLKKLEKLGFENIEISINISAIQLVRIDFVALVSSLIKKYDVNTSNIIFEITESIFANNFKEINEILAQLQQIGIKIALDDFGTGYSSLARERDLNINILKIDKLFIDKLMVINHEKAITSSIILMAHKLGHSVVAEGVEEKKQLDYLVDNDCDMVQGFYFSKPLEEEKAIEFLINHT